MSSEIRSIHEKDIDADHALLLRLDGFEGPIDLLLELSRQQKVDLKEISILALAEQYLIFVQSAHAINLELAAEYLVMAAWLAYLKSRLLLPQEETEQEEPSAEAMAEWLAFQLRRLQAMRDAAEKLTDRPQLGIDFFARGVEEEEAERIKSEKVYGTSLYDLLKAYARQHATQFKHAALQIEETEYYSVEDAVDLLRSWVGKIPEWQDLEKFLPANVRHASIRRSALASTFAATLELAKRHAIKIQQTKAFGPIFIQSDETAKISEDKHAGN